RTSPKRQRGALEREAAGLLARAPYVLLLSFPGSTWSWLPTSPPKWDRSSNTPTSAPSPAARAPVSRPGREAAQHARVEGPAGQRSCSPPGQSRVRTLGPRPPSTGRTGSRRIPRTRAVAAVPAWVAEVGEEARKPWEGSAGTSPPGRWRQRGG